MQVQQRSAGLAAFVLYTLVVLEFLYMITPFLAFSYYAAYGQFLGWLNQYSATAWLTTFFLPHFSKTIPDWPHQVAAWGRWLGLIGIAGFLITAGQIYWAKLARKGMVRGGIYTFVRHPQYAFLILLGVATLMIWPRFLILYALAAMVVLYVWLARHEENVCLNKFGASYADYLQRTGMFFPRLLAPPTEPRQRRSSGVAMAIFFVAIMVIASGIGFGLREYSIRSVSAVYRQHEAIISPAVLPDAEIQRIADLAARDARVTALRAQAAPNTQWIVYVVPTDWYVPDLPIDPLDYVAQHGGHGSPRSYDRTQWQVLFTTARTWRPNANGEDIVRHAYGRTPAALANVDLNAERVTSLVTPPPHVVWGDIPMPIF